MGNSNNINNLFMNHLPNAIMEDMNTNSALVHAVEQKLSEKSSGPVSRAIFKAPPPSWSKQIAKQFLEKPQPFHGDKKLIPPGFYPDREGNFSHNDLMAIHALAFGPDEHEHAKHENYFSEQRQTRGDRVQAEFGEQIDRVWRHEASISEWKEQVGTQLTALDQLLHKVGVAAQDSLAEGVLPPDRLTMQGDIGHIARIPDKNVLLQDLLVLAANEKSTYEALGVSTIYRPGDIDVSGKRRVATPLQLKRFEDTQELLEHLDAVQEHMQQCADAGEHAAPVRSRATFRILSQMHATSVELLTVMHEGVPKTAMLCADSASAAKVAVELKSCLDIYEQHNVALLVVNARSQYSLEGCPVFAVHHPQKLHNEALDNPAFETRLHDLLDGKVSSAAYPLPWGKPDGAKVYFIQNDDLAASQILPLSIVKETQSRSALASSLEQRRASPASRQKIMSRYDHAVAGGEDSPARSTLVNEKTEKYFSQAHAALENLELIYGAEKGGVILRTMLDQIRDVDVDPQDIVGNTAAQPSARDLLTKHIDACKENISLLSLYERGLQISQERYFIEALLDEDDELDREDLSGSDRATLGKLSGMNEAQLQARDRKLASEEMASDAALKLKQLETGKGPEFIHVCEKRKLSVETEQAALKKLESELGRK
ncbi:MAG: hypothetical protein V4754_14765 [Pseudomonadota bacterium]